MTGWRCGFVAGNEMLVRAYGDIKDNNTDSGQFLAIQHMRRPYCFDWPRKSHRKDCRWANTPAGMILTELVGVLQQRGFKAGC